MKYFHSRFQSALRLLDSYSYPEPFHIAVKTFFKHQKKYGSKDRKAISEICYTYFRSGRLFDSVSLTEGLLLGSLFLDTIDIDSWNKESVELGLNYVLDDDFDTLEDSLAYIKEKLGVDLHYYRDGFLMEEFLHYNRERNLKFRPKNWCKEHTDDTPQHLGLIGAKDIMPNEKLESTMQIQDLSSQFICNEIDLSQGGRVWDVCSGAGGKSINLMASNTASFYLSDIRPTIIQNAKSRVKSMHYNAEFGVANIESKQDTIQFDTEEANFEYFDTIVADVPCTGSGTWFRSPEHFTRFDYSKLAMYTQRQKDIVKNSFPFLKSGGVYYYITCSVFSEENEVVTAWIKETFDVQMLDVICFDGIKQKADGMYMASFKKR